jgi:hypothetical protein
MDLHPSLHAPVVQLVFFLLIKDLQIACCVLKESILDRKAQPTAQSASQENFP